MLEVGDQFVVKDHVFEVVEAQDANTYVIRLTTEEIQTAKAEEVRDEQLSKLENPSEEIESASEEEAAS